MREKGFFVLTSGFEHGPTLVKYKFGDVLPDRVLKFFKDVSYVDNCFLVSSFYVNRFSTRNVQEDFLFFVEWVKEFHMDLVKSFDGDILILKESLFELVSFPDDFNGSVNFTVE